MCFSCHWCLHQALCDLRLNALCSFFVFILRHLQNCKEVISLTLSLLPLVCSPVGKKKITVLTVRRINLKLNFAACKALMKINTQRCCSVVMLLGSSRFPTGVNTMSRFSFNSSIQDDCLPL